MKYIETLRKFSKKKVEVEVEVEGNVDRKLLANKIFCALKKKYNLEESRKARNL